MTACSYDYMEWVLNIDHIKIFIPNDLLSDVVHLNCHTSMTIEMTMYLDGLLKL